MKIRESAGSRIFSTVNAAVLVLCSLTVILPFLNVLAVSLSSNSAINRSIVSFWPVGFNFGNYAFVMKNAEFLNSFKVTFFVVILGTSFSMFITLLTSYPLSKSYLPGRKAFMVILVVSMIFQCPIIPYFLTVKTIGFTNTILALVIPGGFSVFYTLLCITFFKTIPEDLFESARIDGMTEFRMLFKIALPLSMPIIVTLLLYFIVGYWNNYQSALYFITSVNLRPLQLYLWSLIAQSNIESVGASVMSEAATKTTPAGLMMATIIVATVPVLLIYPFLQKHFIKGTLLGSLKG
jgi:putative aldouronate transport system permease protein